jgi:hypothetical protein
MKTKFLSCFFSILLGAACSVDSQEASQMNQPLISFDSEHFTFDTLQIGDTLRHQFKFTNTGTKDLKIDTVSSNCDCASGYFRLNPFLPPKQIVLKYISHLLVMDTLLGVL